MTTERSSLFKLEIGDRRLNLQCNAKYNLICLCEVFIRVDLYYRLTKGDWCIHATRIQCLSCMKLFSGWLAEVANIVGLLFFHWFIILSIYSTVNWHASKKSVLILNWIYKFPTLKKVWLKNYEIMVFKLSMWVCLCFVSQY